MSSTIIYGHVNIILDFPIIYRNALITGECLDLQFSNSTDMEVDHDQQVTPIYFRSKVKVNMTFNVDISVFINIFCCTYHVAICRTLNKILLKLTTLLHSHK